MDENWGFWVHHTDLWPKPSGHPDAVEWEAYRREVGRLLAEGREGQYVLIKGNRILGIYDDFIAAVDEWHRRESDRPIMVKRISEQERFGRHAPPMKLCRDTSFPLPRTG